MPSTGRFKGGAMGRGGEAPPANPAGAVAVQPIQLSASRNIADTDANATLYYAGTSDITLTIPAGLTLTKFEVEQHSTGVVRLLTVTGVSINDTTATSTSGPGSRVSLSRTGTDAYNATRAATMPTIPRIILDSDSILAESNIWSGTQTGGVGSVTMSSNSSQYLPGQSIFLANASDDRWNGQFTPSAYSSGGVATIAIDPAAAATATVVGAPHSATLSCMPQQTQGKSIVKWLGALQGLRREIINVSAGSRTTSGMLTDYTKRFSDIAKTQPAGSIVIISVSSNDPVRGISAATTLSNLRARAIGALRAGFRVVIATGIPFGTTMSSYSAAHNVNSQNARMLARELGVDLWDWAAILTDPTSSTGAAISGTLETDDIHPSAYGVALLAANPPSILKNAPGIPIALAGSFLDVGGSGTKNILGGNDQPGTSGVNGAATGWGWTPHASLTTGTLSKVSGFFGATNAQQLSIQGAAGLNSILYSSSVHTTLNANVGKKIRIAAQITEVLNAAFDVGLWLRMSGITYNGSTWGSNQRLTACGPAATSYGPPSGTYVRQVESDEWVIPTGFSCTLARLELSLTPRSAGTGVSTFTLDRPAIWMYE